MKSFLYLCALFRGQEMSLMNRLFSSILFFTGLLCTGLNGYAQDFTKIMGTVIDKRTMQPVPFVNVYFKNSNVQTSTDFDGRYSLETKSPTDTLIAQYIGYQVLKKHVMKERFQYIDFELIPLSYNLTEVVIVPGVNPAEVILKKVISNKPNNNIDEYDAYEYEAYTRMQVDANNFKEKLKDRSIMKPFKFIFDNTDTSIINGKTYLPVLLTETLSDVYCRKEPKAHREIIRANKISGVENKSAAQLLGNSYLKVNLYNNYLDFFEKNFVSPIANFGLAYYKYYLTDSAFIDGRWCYKLNFKPRRVQELTFTGTMWITDTTFALKKVDMRMVNDANINFINEIVIHQEFEQVDGVHYMPVIDNIVADVNITESGVTVGFYVHRNTSFRNIVVNRLRPSKDYETPQDIIVLDSATKKDASYWASVRHDSLTKEQKNIYKLVDTIQTIPAFKIYKGIASLLITGYRPWGYFEFGPWLSTYSYNTLEGSRFRVGGRTSNKFSTMMMIEAHLAYGTKDEVFKYGANFWYRFKKNPNSGFGISYSYDIEQLGEGQKALVVDNLLGSLIRRNPNNKLSMVRETKGFYEHEWFFGFDTKLYISNRINWPMGSNSFAIIDNGQVRNLPFITTSEISFYTHFALHEKFLSGEFDRFTLGSKYPQIDLNYGYGAKGLWNGDYAYHRLQINLQQWFNVGTIGWSKYIIETGKVWGKLPYVLLKLHEANETFWFEEHTANTMNYYEFVSDEYISLFYTHHFDGLLFNKIPLLRKLKWREVIHGKCIMGSLSNENKSYNILPAKTYTLTKPFYEVGAGIENIFTVARIDAMWRLSYLNHPNISKFQVMISFHFTF